MNGGYRLGIDIGGTFTDCVVRTPDGTTVVEKAPTTPHDRSLGVLDVITRSAAALGLADAAALLARTETIVHGTTTGDNTMIQMSGAPTGLLVTAGFRDEIEMRRCYKEDIWDPTLGAPEPIARRRVRLEVRERLTAEGTIDTPLVDDDVRAAVRRLRRLGVTSIAVVFLHSYINPVHELRAREIIAEEYPDVALVSLSHEVYPKPPEFERTSTTLVNAYVGPPIVAYLDRLRTALESNAFEGELLIATSAGGVASIDSITRRAVATIGSGPTGGVIAAARAASDAGLGDTVSVDMGGTSYDVCLIRDGRGEVKSDWNWRHRYCIALPMVDIHGVGAGGGSIATSDAHGIRVGPESAGAQPGPVCYGRGGTRATVSDADVVLGRLDPESFWGGRLTLDVQAAHDALARLGDPLGLDAEDAARAVATVVDAHMTDAIRRVLSLAGVDPRTLDLVAFGGMGAVHATTQAAALGMRRVLVPRAASAFSALGLLAADHVIDIARTHIAPWQTVDVDAINALADELHAHARSELAGAGVGDDRIEYTWLLNLVYPGQTFDTAIPIERPHGSTIDGAAIAACVETFHRRNEAARLIEARAQEPTIRGVRLVATGRVPRPTPRSLDVSAARANPTSRRVWCGGTWTEAAVHDLEALGRDDTVSGPAVLQSQFTTIVLRPADVARVLTNGDVLIDIG